MSNRLYIVLSALSGAALIYLFFVVFEPYDEEQDLGWQKPALHNPYLAAELYLKGLGVNVFSADKFEQIQNQGQSPLLGVDTLFMSNSNQILSEKRLHKIVDWVDRGGALIVAVQPPSELSHDRILEHLNITAYLQDVDWWDQELGPKLKKADGPSEYEASIDASELTRLKFSGDDANIDVHFDSAVTLYHPALHRNNKGADDARDVEVPALEPFYWQGDEHGVHIIQVKLGEGVVTVMSDPDMFKSDNISAFDHAYLWHSLTQSKGVVVILYGAHLPGLWTVIKTYLPELVCIFLLWLLAWLWYVSQRFGPVISREVRIRRSMSEHIFASASYLWRGGWHSEMLDPIRETVTRRAIQVIPGFSSLSVPMQHKALGSACGIDAKVVARTMHSPPHLTEDQFFRIVQVLQKIRKSL